MVPGKKMKNEAVRNNMKKKEKGERGKEKEKKGNIFSPGGKNIIYF